MSRPGAVLLTLLAIGCSSSQREAAAPIEDSGATGAAPSRPEAEPGDLAPPGNVFGKRPYAVYEPAEGEEVVVEAGRWKVAARNGGGDSPLPTGASPEDGWFRTFRSVGGGSPAGAGPRAIRPIELGAGVHAFVYSPARMEVGRLERVPLLVMNFGDRPVEVLVAIRVEGPIEGAGPREVALRVEPGRTSVHEIEVRPAAEGLARLHVQAWLEGGPSAGWQTSEVEVSPSGSS